MMTMSVSERVIGVGTITVKFLLGDIGGGAWIRMTFDVDYVIVVSFI